MMFARTARLLLRPIWAEDAAFLAMVGGYRAAPCPAPSKQAAVRHPELLIVARVGAAAEPVGWIGLFDRGGATMLDGRIRIDRRNRGYATEAGHALVAIAAMLDIGRLDAHPAGEGPAAAVLRNLGFVATGSAGRPATMRLHLPTGTAAPDHRIAA